MKPTNEIPVVHRCTLATNFSCRFISSNRLTTVIMLFQNALAVVKNIPLDAITADHIRGMRAWTYQYIMSFAGVQLKKSKRQ